MHNDKKNIKSQTPLSKAATLNENAEKPTSTSPPPLCAVAATSKRASAPLLQREPALPAITLKVMSDPLDTTNLLRSLLALLPRASDSPLRNPTDAIAALVHTIHTALDFRLINPAPAANTTSSSNTAASGEEEDTDDAASETATAVDQDEGSDVPNQLAEGWNARGEDSYVFEYRHEQSSMVFRVRIGRMGGRVQIDAMAEVCLLP